MMVGSSPGGQRRRTIPRGAQFCSIYLQNHINKCCRIVQLLKSKAAWWRGDVKDERSLQRWWHYKARCSRKLIAYGEKMEDVPYFLFHSAQILSSSVLHPWQWLNNTNKNLIAFSLSLLTHKTSLPCILAATVSSPFISPYTVISIIVHEKKKKKKIRPPLPPSLHNMILMLSYK